MWSCGYSATSPELTTCAHHQHYLMHTGRGAQGMNRVLFISEAGESHRDVAAPLLLISLLERCRGADGEDLVLQALQRMSNLLESYYHPSNTGQ